MIRLTGKALEAKQLRQTEIVEAAGWLTPREGRMLAKHAAGKTVLEIGSYCGRSTIWLARVAKSVDAVDTFDGHIGPSIAPRDTLPEFLTTLDRYGVRAKVRVHRGMSGAVVPKLGKYDFIFVDAAHDEASVRTDIANAMARLRPGGLIAAHDYHNQFHPDVSRVLDSLIANGKLEKIDRAQTLIILRPAPSREQPLIEHAKCCGATSDTALLTINIGGVMAPKSRASFQHAARRWGADYVEFVAPLRDVGGRPHWQKAFLAEWAQEHGYKRCVYYDADILIRSDCPNVIELALPGTIGVCSNDQIDGGNWKPGEKNHYRPALAWWARKLGLPEPPTHEHANSGMVVFEPEAHRAFFDAWAAAGKACGFGSPVMLIDQAAFSVLLSGTVKATWLPMQFNTLIYRHELIRAAGQMQSFVYHYTGHRKHKLNETEWMLGRPLQPRADRRQPAPTVASAAPPRRTASPTLLGLDVDLSRLFERTVCINLDRRADRWDKFTTGLPSPWPFAPIQRLRAVDVQRCPPPAWFKIDAGQWGCRQSHLRAIEDALNDGVNSLLVFEDDAEFCPDFLAKVGAFIASVPDDWEILMLGGRHTRGQRTPVNEQVETPGYVTLAHAYALRGNGLRLAYQHAHEHTPQQAEIDHRLGSLIQSGRCAAYAPRQWLVYQSEGFSDLTLRHRPLRGRD